MSGSIALRAGKKKPPRANWTAVSVYSSQTSCGVPDQQEAADGDGPKQVAEDENVLAVATVGDDARQRADEKRGEHPYRKQAPDSESGTGELGQEGGGGDQVEPVAQQARDLPEPEIPETGVAPNQLPIARRRFLRAGPALQSLRHGWHPNNSRWLRSRSARMESISWS